MKVSMDLKSAGIFPANFSMDFSTRIFPAGFFSWKSVRKFLKTPISSRNPAKVDEISGKKPAGNFLRISKSTENLLFVSTLLPKNKKL